MRPHSFAGLALLTAFFGMPSSRADIARDCYLKEAPRVSLPAGAEIKHFERVKSTDGEHASGHALVLARHGKTCRGYLLVYDYVEPDTAPLATADCDFATGKVRFTTSERYAFSNDSAGPSEFKHEFAGKIAGSKLTGSLVDKKTGQKKALDLPAAKAPIAAAEAWQTIEKLAQVESCMKDRTAKISPAERKAAAFPDNELSQEIDDQAFFVLCSDSGKDPAGLLQIARSSDPVVQAKLGLLVDHAFNVTELQACLSKAFFASAPAASETDVANFVRHLEKMLKSDGSLGGLRKKFADFLKASAPACTGKTGPASAPCAHYKNLLQSTIGIYDRLVAEKKALGEEKSDRDELAKRLASLGK